MYFWTPSEFFAITNELNLMFSYALHVHNAVTFYGTQSNICKNKYVQYDFQQNKFLKFSLRMKHNEGTI
jgi:hypothetical protein